MKSFTVVHVIWLDSEADPSWTEVSELTDELPQTHSVGLLIKENKTFVHLALSYDPETKAVNSHKKIPRAAIKEIRTLCRLKLKS